MKNARLNVRRTILLALLSTSPLSIAACDGQSPTGPAPTAAAPAAVNVTLNVESLVLQTIGESAQLQAWVSGSTESPQWSSSNPNVAIVDHSGVLTAVGEGTAVITVSVGSAVDQAEVLVHQGELW